MSLIFQALEWGAKLHHEDLHLQELGIATLSSLFVNANRGKDSEAAKPSNFYYFQTQSEQAVSIPVAVCDAFFSCIKDGILPAWAVPLCPIDALEKGKSGGKVPRPRLWVGDGVILILPQIQGKQVSAAFALINQAEGIIDVKDPDSDRWFAVEVPDEDCWILEAEFPIVDSKIVLLS
jgi:hypothetical protein